MGARRRCVFISEVPARSYLEFRRRLYSDGDGGAGLSRRSGPCRSGGGLCCFTLELSHAHVLAIACKQKFVLDSYEDEAVGHLEKNADGKLARVELRPKITWG